MRRLYTARLAVACLLLMLAAASASAEPVTITPINPARQSAFVAGERVTETFRFTFANAGNTAASINIGVTREIIGDVAGSTLQSTLLPLILSPNTTLDLDFLTLTLTTRETPIFSFARTARGITFFADGIRLNTVTISITRGNVPEPVPEPASMILLGTGLAGTALKRRRRG